MLFSIESEIQWTRKQINAIVIHKSCSKISSYNNVNVSFACEQKKTDICIDVCSPKVPKSHKVCTIVFKHGHRQSSECDAMFNENKYLII